MNTQTQEALKMIDAIQIKYSDLIYNEAGFEKAEEFEDDIIAIKEALATNKESSLVQPAQEPTVKEKNIMNASLILEQIKSILNGIDKTETENGWWETSCGAEFGSEKLKELLALVDKEKNHD